MIQWTKTGDVQYDAVYDLAHVLHISYDIWMHDSDSDVI